MSKVQLFIGIRLLDFNNEINVKRQVNDYRDPAIGGTATSYTLAIPLTKTNRAILGYPDDLRSRVEVADEARLVVNGVEIIRGKLRILTLNIYEARAIIEASDWVNDVAAINMSDLTFPGQDYTASAVQNSWTGAAGTFIRYPFINWGELMSEGYGAGSDVYPWDFYPMFNLEDIVDRVCSLAGYTLDSAGFFATTFGRALYCLAQPKVYNSDHIVGKEMSAYVNATSDNYHSISIPAGGTGYVLNVAQVMVMDGETIDEGSDYSTGTHQYTAPEDGTYRFKSEIQVWSDPNRAPSRFTVNQNYLTYTIRKNGTTTLATTYQTGGTLFNIGNSFEIDTGYIHLESGDTVEVYIDVEVNFDSIAVGTEYPALYIQQGATVSYLECIWDNRCLWPGLGRSVVASEFMPDINGVDFFKGLKEAFGLRFFVDRNQKTIYIETSNDFYGSTVIDWTEKVDYSQPVEMEIISSNYKQNQILKWKADTADKAYTDEVSANGVPYKKDIVIDSAYVRVGTEERENPIFGPTPIGDMYQIGHYSDLIPRIFGREENTTTGRPWPDKRLGSWVPRILHWSGLTALTTGNWDWYTSLYDTSATNYTTFPKAVTPDMSDMYDDYLLKDWRRIENNKIVTCTLRLTPSEIMKFMTVIGTAANEGFRATYKLNIEGNDMLFICSKIITNGDLVKAEFIQKM